MEICDYAEEINDIQVISLGDDTMGFAFNMDELAEKTGYVGINTGWNPVSSEAARAAELRRQQRRKALQDVSMQYTKAIKTNNIEVVKRTRKQIETELVELETSLYYFRVCEKNLLRVANKYSMDSVVISDIIDGLLEYYNDSCDAIIDLKEEIRKNSGFDFKSLPKEVNEEKVKKEIVKMIFDVVENGISKGLPLSREMFRSVVKDLEKVLEVLEYNGNPVKKAQVEEYFVINYKKKSSMIICQNCKKAMLEDIPYCFNCFDGRYS